MSKILKYLYSCITNDYEGYYRPYDELFIIINKLNIAQQYTMIKKLIPKIILAIVSQNTRNDYMKFQTVQSIINKCVRSTIAQHCYRVLEYKTVKKLLRRILYRKVVIYIPMKLQKYFYEIMKKSSGNYLFGILQLADYIGIISMRDDVKLYQDILNKEINIKFTSDYLEKVANVSNREIKRKKTQLAVYLLLFITNNKNIQKRIMKTYLLYFKGKYRIAYEKILLDIIHMIDNSFLLKGEYGASNMLVGKLHLLEREFENLELHSVSNILEKGGFIKEVSNALKNAIGYICDGFIYNMGNFVTYFRGIFDGNKYGELTSLHHRKIKYKIVTLFPMILASVKNYIKLNENIYFTTVDNLLTNEHVKNQFCGDADCLDLYKMKFMPKTPKIVRNIYGKLMRVYSDAFRNFYFYLPIIINMKTKKIIIADFMSINKLVTRMLRRSLK